MSGIIVIGSVYYIHPVLDSLCSEKHIFSKIIMAIIRCIVLYLEIKVKADVASASLFYLHFPLDKHWAAGFYDAFIPLFLYSRGVVLKYRLNIWEKLLGLSNPQLLEISEILKF